MSDLKAVHMRLFDDEQEAFRKLSERDGAPVAWHLRKAALNYLRVMGMRVKAATQQRGGKGGE